MHFLIVLFISGFLGVPRNVVTHLNIQKTNHGSVLKIKLRKNYLPTTDAWWFKKELRLRIKNSRFSTIINFKKLKTNKNDFIISGHYEDKQGCVLKIKFKNYGNKPDFSISYKLGEVLFSVKTTTGIVENTKEIKSNTNTENEATKKLLKTAPVLTSDKLLNKNSIKQKENKSNNENSTNSTEKSKDKSYLVKKTNKLGESVKKSLKSSSLGKSKSSGGSSWFSTIIVLLFLGILGGVAYFIIKKQKGTVFEESSKIEILAKKQLTREHKIVVVKFGGRILVLGLTNGSISMLTEFIPSFIENTEPEIEDNNDDNFKPQNKSTDQSTPESVEGILKLKKQKQLDKNSLKISQMEDATSQAAFLSELKKHL